MPGSNPTKSENISVGTPEQEGIIQDGSPNENKGETQGTKKLDRNADLSQAD
jgi:hypothetical protein